MEENKIKSEKVIPGTDEALLSSATVRVPKCGKYLLCFDLMMRRDRGQTDGMGGLLMKRDCVKKQ